MNDTACHRKPNGRRPAAEDSKTPRTPGETNHRKHSNTSMVRGVVPDLSANRLQTVMACLTWATTFMNGVWTGTRKITTRNRRKKTREVQRKEAVVYRVAAPGAIRSRHHALPTEAVCRRITGIRTTVSEL